MVKLLFLFSVNSTCKKLIPVRDVARGIHSNIAFKAQQSDMTKILTALSIMRISRHRNLSKLDQAHTAAKTSINNLKTKFDQMVQETLVEVDRQFNKVTKEIKSDITTCTISQDQIKKLQTHLTGDNSSCEILAFEVFKKCQVELAIAESSLALMNKEDIDLPFIPDPLVEKYLSTPNMLLGKFNAIPNDSASESQTDDVPLTANIQTETMAHGRDTTDWVYTTDISQVQTVKVGENRNTIVTGMCQLPGGQLVLINQMSNIIKLIDPFTYAQIAKLDVDPVPCDVCLISDTRLAVTVCTDTAIQSKPQQMIYIVHVDLENKVLVTTNYITLEHPCFGIVYHEDYLFISSATAIYKYTPTGRQVSKVYEDATSIGTSISRFCFSDDGDKIYIANPAKDLIVTVDRFGKMLAAVSSPNLIAPTGICTADDGTLIVSYWLSNTVVQIDRHGNRVLTTIATEADDIYCPEMTWFDKQTKQLWIGQNCDKCLVFKLSKVNK